MQLNGEQRKRFHESLLSAFPSKPPLKQMVDFELDENLDAIAMGENHSDTVFELINWARKEGKVKILLTAARKSNPDNPELRSFEQYIQDKFDENSQSEIDTNPSNCEIPEENNSTPQTIVNPTPSQTKPIPEDDLSSEKGVDYTRLRDLLKARKWDKADRETLLVMLEVTYRETLGWLDEESINKFPCTDLNTIDKLWVRYSKGRYGFSVQKDIWEIVCGNSEVDDETWCKFYECLGWVTYNSWFDSLIEVKSETSDCKGHFPQATQLRRKRVKDILTPLFEDRMSKINKFYVLRFDKSKLNCEALFSSIKTCKETSKTSLSL